MLDHFICIAKKYVWLPNKYKTFSLFKLCNCHDYKRKRRNTIKILKNHILLGDISYVPDILKTKKVIRQFVKKSVNFNYIPKKFIDQNFINKIVMEQPTYIFQIPSEYKNFKLYYYSFVKMYKKSGRDFIFNLYDNYPHNILVKIIFKLIVKDYNNFILTKDFFTEKLTLKLIKKHWFLIEYLPNYLITEKIKIIIDKSLPFK